jgi:hypothetical protein
VPPYGLQVTELEAYGRLTGPIVVPVRIQFAFTGGTLKLTWSSGTLESAPNAPGPYTAVPNATSPFDITPQGDRQFYRVRQ